MHARSGAAALFAAVVAAGARADASPERGEGPRDGEPTAEREGDPDRALSPAGAFWEWLLEPHEREIQVVLDQARQNLELALTRFEVWEPGGRYNRAHEENRRRLLKDAEEMLRHGLRLAPDRPELLYELGRVADENNRPEVALRALERYLAAERPARIPAEARWRRGRILARQGRFREAVTELRHALGTPHGARRRPTQMYLTLASAYMELSRLPEAIDLLQHAGIRSALRGGDFAVKFALAVAYDRDEQITLAHEVLAKITAGGQTQNLLQVLYDPQADRPLQFAPPIDRHYFRALQLEAMGHLVEARREWRAYAAHPGARYRGRALEHVAAIDRTLTSRREAPR